MKRLIFWVLIFTAIVGAAASVRLVLNSRKTIPAAVPLSEPPRAPFRKSIGARGLVESVNENVRIAAAVPGLVAKVNVKVGDTVKAGEVLAEQDTRDAAALVVSQQAEFSALRKQLDEAEVSLADKRDQWARMEKLIATKVASEDEKQRKLFATQTAEAQFASMSARIASAEAQLNRTKVQLDLLTIRAPRDGRILQVNTRAGEFASPMSAEPILILGQTEELQLRADIDEDNASRVRTGMAAMAYIKGRRDIEVPLRFVRIEPYIVPKKSLTGESSERVDTRVLQIIYRFDRPTGAGIYVGQQMDVFLDDGK
ncbi:MAG: efflux RND transporter periplasmic adaptor subunit [Chthoniobacteraceae bacterium]